MLVILVYIRLMIYFERLFDTTIDPQRLEFTYKVKDDLENNKPLKSQMCAAWVG